MFSVQDIPKSDDYLHLELSYSLLFNEQVFVVLRYTVYRAKIKILIETNLSGI